MRMNIVLILLLSINGINCVKDGMPINLLPIYSNFIVTIRQFQSTPSLFKCSGSILTERHVVTAGHCVHNNKNYEIYVTAGRIDLNAILSVMVHEIHLHPNFERVYKPSEPGIEYWSNDIAILELVTELTWHLHIEPMVLSSDEWMQAIADRCYIMGWTSNPQKMSEPILQWADVLILVGQCRPRETLLSLNEIQALISTVPASLDMTDIGTSLICNGQAIGMVVSADGPLYSLITVLTFSPYQHFIKYIVNGGVASIERAGFPPVVSIWGLGHFRCGGFAVHPHYIVTAAHCVKDMKRTDLIVMSPNLEIAKIDMSSQKSRVKSINIHPLYSLRYRQYLGGYVAENNIAVLKLERPLQWNTRVEARDLPDLSQISADKPCEIFRWTQPNTGDPAFKILGKSFGRILNNEENEQTGVHLEETLFRVKSFYKMPSATEADVGNPVIFENNLIGMVIAVDSRNLLKTDPVTCLKIFPYRDFIRNVINEINV